MPLLNGFTLNYTNKKTRLTFCQIMQDSTKQGEEQ